ncbi:MAG: tetratricopeptide repeat-containing sulfotransferase family protein [Akkermansiaceae bacterium]
MSAKKRQTAKGKKQKTARRHSQALQAQIKSIARSQKKASAGQKATAQAVSFWEQLEFDKAIKYFKRAHRLEPHNIDIYLDLGRAHLLHFDQASADAIFDKALKKTNRSITTLMCIAESYQKVPRYDLAEPFYREACMAEDAPAAAFLLHANALERMHRIHEAEDALTKAELISPDHPQLWLQQVHILKRKEQYSEAKALLEKLSARNDVPYETQWKSHYALAQIHNALNDYSAAIKCFLTAKNILRNEGEQSRAQLDKVNLENDRAMPHLTKDRFNAWHTRAKDLGKTRPLAMLIGHPRSGTTLLEQILDSHNGLISSDESTIFGNEVSTPIAKATPKGTTLPEMLDSLTTDTIEMYRERYWKYTESYVRESIGERTLLDKNPSLTLQLPVISAVFPETKIIFALRDPRDTIISCFMQELMMNSISLTYLDLQTACEQYARIMGLWLHLREVLKNPWLEIRYEDLVKNTEEESKRVLTFLDLQWDETVLDYHTRAQKKFVSSPTYSDVTQKVYQGAMGRWKNYQKHLEPHLHILEPFIKAFGYEPS